LNLQARSPVIFKGGGEEEEEEEGNIL
jgi:hypothetical protein